MFGFSRSTGIHRESFDYKCCLLFLNKFSNGATTSISIYFELPSNLLLSRRYMYLDIFYNHEKKFYLYQCKQIFCFVDC